MSLIIETIKENRGKRAVVFIKNGFRYDDCILKECDGIFLKIELRDSKIKLIEVDRISDITILTEEDSNEI